MAVLLTGAAGFIGFHTAEALLERGEQVIGVDNLNDYYDVSLKEARLARLTQHAGFSIHRIDISDRGAMEALAQANPDIDGIVHLAAQAGVRYSLENPYAYVESNLVGQIVVLEVARHLPRMRHLVYASSSSVYGGNTKLPFALEDPVESPVSLYAATKRADELMGHCYSHLYRIPMTGLRFFTVYGRWGRPDMALFKFTKAIFSGEPIDVYNNGNMSRDFTYIDDIVEAMRLLIDAAPSSPDTCGEKCCKADSKSKVAPFRVINIGNTKPQKLMHFIEFLEECIGIKARKNFLPMQAGDVPHTWADTTLLTELTGYAAETNTQEGLRRFVDWYKKYYEI